MGESSYAKRKNALLHPVTTVGLLNARTAIKAEQVIAVMPHHALYGKKVTTADRNTAVQNENECIPLSNRIVKREVR